jgi:hypothetical protein
MPVGVTVVGPSEIVTNEVDPTSSLRHTFLLKNAASYPLTIRSVAAGCACLTTRLATYELQAGATVPLDVEVFSFDKHRSSYHQVIEILTDHNQLDLHLRGTLALPVTPLFRPHTVFMEAVSGTQAITRDVHVRVPRHLCRDLSVHDLKIEGCDELTAELLEEAPSELYRDFRITLTAPRCVRVKDGGHLAIDTGSGKVVVKLMGIPGNVE